jgi:hypothetical protein
MSKDLSRRAILAGIAGLPPWPRQCLPCVDPIRSLQRSGATRQPMLRRGLSF